MTWVEEKKKGCEARADRQSRAAKDVRRVPIELYPRNLLMR